MTRYCRDVDCHVLCIRGFLVFSSVLLPSPSPCVVISACGRRRGRLLLMMHVYCQKYACVSFCGFMHTIVLSLKHLCVNTVTYCTQIYAYCKWESLKLSCFYMNLKATTLNLPEYNSYFYVHAFRFVGVCGKVLKRCRRDTYYQYCSGEIVKHMASVQRTLFQVTLYIVQFSFNHTAGRCY